MVTAINYGQFYDLTEHEIHDEEEWEDAELDFMDEIDWDWDGVEPLGVDELPADALGGGTLVQAQISVERDIDNTKLLMLCLNPSHAAREFLKREPTSYHAVFDQLGYKIRGLESLEAPFGLKLTQSSRYLARSIERAKRLLHWDLEPGEIAVAESTIRKAVVLIIRATEAYAEHYDFEPSAPKFTPGPEGSVDITWREGTRRLFINVRASAEDPTTYDCCDEADIDAENYGFLSHNDSNEWVLAWLTNRS